MILARLMLLIIIGYTIGDKLTGALALVTCLAIGILSVLSYIDGYSEGYTKATGELVKVRSDE